MFVGVFICLVQHHHDPKKKHSGQEESNKLSIHMLVYKRERKLIPLKKNVCLNADSPLQG